MQPARVQCAGTCSVRWGGVVAARGITLLAALSLPIGPVVAALPDGAIVTDASGAVVARLVAYGPARAPAWELERGIRAERTGR